MTQDRVLDRVRKMLALANDAAATEGERDNAMRMAYATLAKHNLDMADVGSNQTQEVREEQMSRMSAYPWARAIAHSVAGLFFCSYYYARAGGASAHHYFVGRQSNAITANEMAQYIISSVFKELRQRFPSQTAPQARAFATGVADALRVRCYRLRKEAEQASQVAQAGTGRELVLASLYDQEQKANQAWMDANVGELVTQKDRSHAASGSAYNAGISHGKSISLNNQIGTAANSKTLKLGR